MNKATTNKEIINKVRDKLDSSGTFEQEDYNMLCRDYPKEKEINFIFDETRRESYYGKKKLVTFLSWVFVFFILLSAFVVFMAQTLRPEGEYAYWDMPYVYYLVGATTFYIYHKISKIKIQIRKIELGI